MATRMIALLYADDFSWLPEYTAHVPQIVASCGGSYDFVATGPVEVIEGTMPVPAGIGIFDFPSREAAKQFLHSEEYQPFVDLRNRHSRTEILLFDGEKR